MEKSIKYRAIVIGINHYGIGIPPLKTAVNDAIAIAQILTEIYKYDVQLIIEQEETALNPLMKLIQSLSNPLQWKGAWENEKGQEHLIIYFAGHGQRYYKKNGELDGFLVPSDGAPGSPMLSMNKVEESLQKRNPHHLLVILDCCFAGAFPSQPLFRSSSISGHLYREEYLRFLGTKTRYLLASSSFREKALDSPSRDFGMNAYHSPFAQILMRGLKGEADRSANGGKGIVLISELFLFIRDEFLKLSHIQNQIRKHEAGNEDWINNFGQQFSTEDIIPMPNLSSLRGHDHGEFLFCYTNPNLKAAPKLKKGNNPYLSLNEYSRDDQQKFFGREKETGLVVMGTSGSHNGKNSNFKGIVGLKLCILSGNSGQGKSSLINAGISPLLESLQYVVLPVLRSLQNPFETLNGLIIKWLESENNIELTLPEKTNSTDGFEILIEVAENNPNQDFLLIIDQLEELVTICKPDVRMRFLSRLSSILKNSPKNFKILLSVWNEYNSHFSTSQIGKYWVENSIYTLEIPGKDQLRKIVDGPIRGMGMFFYPPNLVEQIVYEAQNTLQPLPHLSFTLSELYDVCLTKPQEEQRIITSFDYDKTGGISRSLVKKATQLKEEISKAGMLNDLKNVILRMVTQNVYGLSKRPIWLSDFTDKGFDSAPTGIKTVLGKLIESRLIVASNQIGPYKKEDLLIQPAHDALLREWKEISKWIKEFGGKEKLDFFHAIIDNARIWDLMERKGDFLFHKRIEIEQSKTIKRRKNS